MLPSLSPLSDRDRAGSAGSGAVLVPPPPSFRPPRGAIRDVTVTPVNYVRATGNTAAKMAGLRFEAKCQARLAAQWPEYLPSPRIDFWDDTGHRFVWPDGLLALHDRLVLFEIKRQHMPEAWWQLERLYRPLLAAGSRLPTQVIEIVHTYDPQMPFPCPVTLVQDLLCWTRDESALVKFGVVVWRP